MVSFSPSQSICRQFLRPDVGNRRNEVAFITSYNSSRSAAGTILTLKFAIQSKCGFPAVIQVSGTGTVKIEEPDIPKSLHILCLQ
jgi:hypothetical protein